jgi:hypothetical protein
MWKRYATTRLLQQPFVLLRAPACRHSLGARRYFHPKDDARTTTALGTTSRRKEDRDNSSSSSSNNTNKQPPNPFHHPPPETLRRLRVPAPKQHSQTQADGRADYQYTQRRREKQSQDSQGQWILHSRAAAPTTAPAGRRVVHTVNAAVWLEPRNYIMAASDASTVKSGTEGALRLNLGRCEWLTTVRKHVSRGRRTHRDNEPAALRTDNFPGGAYRLEGHGVPHQLFQTVLQQAVDGGEARGESPATIHNRTSDIDDGAVTELYLTVMHRLAAALAVVLEEPDLHTAVSSRRTWQMKVQGMAALPDKSHSDDPHPQLWVEWNLAQRQVYLHLVGPPHVDAGPLHMMYQSNLV